MDPGTCGELGQVALGDGTTDIVGCALAWKRN